MLIKMIIRYRIHYDLNMNMYFIKCCRRANFGLSAYIHETVTVSEAIVLLYQDQMV